jgi:hypothetical protein
MIVWSTIVVMAVIAIGLHMMFFYRLRRDCHEEWVRLGSPSPFLANDTELAWRLAKYVLTGSFERLPDKNVVSLGRTLRYVEWCYITVFVIATFLFFYSLRH